MKTFFIFFSIICVYLNAFTQNKDLVFVHLSDTHIGSGTGADDLRRTLADINSIDSIQFVVISGDITEFGADDELKLAKQILDSLKKPWYIIPGNHDGNWSESGANSFNSIFGGQTFHFNAGDYIFLGTHCGPNMRMGPGQIPREDIMWLDSTLKTIPDDQPIIFMNHYPQDPGLNNWYDAIDRLKQKNIQLILCGHGHSNRLLNFEGIPGIMGRSNLRAKEEVGGYNIVNIQHNTITYRVRVPGQMTKPSWVTVNLFNHHFKDSINIYPRPSYAVNDSFPAVKEKWSYQDKSDIGSGSSVSKGKLFTTNTNGEIIALQVKTGKPVWQYQTEGKIYSIPAVGEGMVITGSSDGYIYAVSQQKGKLRWKLKTDKAVLGHPVINNNIVYVGSSDGHFRAINIADGKIKWDFTEVAGFIVTRPLIYSGRIYFGCWRNDFYCLDLATGKLIWKWNNGSGNRMYSPAVCFPVAVANRIFFVAPDRFMTCLNAITGEEIWRKQQADLRVRESMGISADSSLIFVKTMEGNVFGISTSDNYMNAIWKTDASLGYEICPTGIVEYNGTVFVPTQSGMVVAINRASGKTIWKHKISNGLITHILPLNDHQLITTAMDGKLCLLQY